MSSNGFGYPLEDYGEMIEDPELLDEGLEYALEDLAESESDQDVTWNTLCVKGIELLKESLSQQDHPTKGEQ